MIFVERPRHISAGDAEAWLEWELEPLRGDGIDRIRLRRLRSGSLRFAQSWAFMVEVDCRDVTAARAAVQDGPGLALLADMRLLGMRPSMVLVEDSD